MNGITFGNLHSYDDLGLILTGREIGSASVKRYAVNIPGGDGEIDLTDYFGEPKYDNRSLKYKFVFFGNRSSILNKYSEICSKIHGVLFDSIVDDMDSEYFWKGRCDVSDLSISKNVAEIEVNIDAEPYKYKNSITTVTGTVGSNKNIIPNIYLWTGTNGASIVNNAIILPFSGSRASSTFAPVTSGSTISISALTSTESIRCYIHEFTSEDSPILASKQFALTNGKSQNITLDSNVNFIKISVYPSSSSKFPIKIERFMVEVNTECTDYVPHNGVLCVNDRMSTIPTVTVSKNNTLLINGRTGTSVSLSAGTYTVSEFQLISGDNIIETSGSGTITIKWQEGVL